MSTDLDEVVAAVVQAAIGMPPPRRPWLEPLGERLLWSSAGVETTPELAPLPFGLHDLPHQQRQSAATFDLHRDGHLFFVGAPASGRTQCLLTLAGSVAELARVDKVHLYAIDDGAGGLRALEMLPHCGAVVAREEFHRAVRLLQRLVDELEQRHRNPDPDAPHILVMIDRWEGFVARCGDASEPFDAVARVLREGAAVGIHLVITGDRTLLAHQRVSAATDLKYILRLTDVADYQLAGLSVRRGSDHPPGRCWGPGAVETQVYLLDDDPRREAQEEALRNLGELARRRATGDTRRPFRIDRLPTRVDLGLVRSLLVEGPEPTPVVGVGGDELAALSPALERSVFAVIGPPRSGRTSVLMGAAAVFLMGGGEVVVVTARPQEWNWLAHEYSRLRIVDGRAVHRAATDVISDRALVLVDDLEALQSPSLDALLSEAAGGSAGAFVIIAGGVRAFLGGMRSWQGVLRQADQGLLLSPRSPHDGDAIGVSLPRMVVGGPIHPGYGWLHRGGGELLEVATFCNAQAP